MKNLLGYGAFSVSDTKCSSFTSSVIFHLAYFIVNYYLFCRNNIGKSLSMLGTKAIRNMKGKPLYNNISILRDMFLNITFRHAQNNNTHASSIY